MKAASFAKQLTILWIILVTTSACLPEDLTNAAASGNAVQAAAETPTPQPSATPMPTRPAYQPGELVDYTAQAGDTLAALAVHFNTTVKEIRAANAFIPADATTMPPGMPMKIPIYYQAFWGTRFQIIPDSLFINGPAEKGFKTADFVNQQPGWLKNLSEYVEDRNRTGAEIVDYVATQYSVSPRLLLAILDYQAGALSQPAPPDGVGKFPLLQQDYSHEGVYRQLVWAANLLNSTYYSWRAGLFTSFDLSDREMQLPDPWQNAATVSLQYYFSRHLSHADFDKAVSADGLAATYRRLFGDPWATPPHIPGSLRQPYFRLPFQPGNIWAYTGGPHSAWGTDQPLAAIDFAPPSTLHGCADSDLWVTAVADGSIVRTGDGIAVLDTDGDGDEHTGWVVFYLHLAIRDKIPLGSRVKAGQPIGHPSCEGGNATGTHVHLARKYNGEWILADGPLAFNLEDWISHSSGTKYQGTLTRGGRTLVACTCSDENTHLQTDVH